MSNEENADCTPYEANVAEGTASAAGSAAQPVEEGTPTRNVGDAGEEIVNVAEPADPAAPVPQRPDQIEAVRYVQATGQTETRLFSQVEWDRMDKTGWTRIIAADIEEEPAQPATGTITK
jgi:hypothetical protein